MTVQPGADWGTEAELPTDAVAVTTDAELAALVTTGESRPLVLRGGDLFRTLGAPTPRAAVHRFPLDALRVIIDGRETVAVAHVIARRSWWRGEVVAVMNAEYVGGWDVAPRSHPNDGRADVVTLAAAATVRERWQAWRRLPHGTHVPHPNIAVRKTRAETFTFARPVAVWVDGVRRRGVRELTVTVHPDAFAVHV